MGSDKYRENYLGNIGLSHLFVNSSAKTVDISLLKWYPGNHLDVKYAVQIGPNICFFPNPPKNDILPSSSKYRKA